MFKLSPRILLPLYLFAWLLFNHHEIFLHIILPLYFIFKALRLPPFINNNSVSTK
jgi:hypothetical protein